MSLTDVLAVVVTPVLFVGWGIVLGMPEAQRGPRSRGGSWWQEPRVSSGIAAVAIAMLASAAFDHGGDVARFVVLLCLLPTALGWAFALWWRRKPIRSRDPW